MSHTYMYKGFVLRLDLDTGVGSISKGIRVASACWDGMTLTCPDVPRRAIFELEVMVIAGLIAA